MSVQRLSVKNLLFVSFTLFSMFFGAGNPIFPKSQSSINATRCAQTIIDSALNGKTSCLRASNVLQRRSSRPPGSHLNSNGAKGNLQKFFRKLLIFSVSYVIINTACESNYLGEFPSGQRGQTVNLLAMPSVVRIHLRPLRVSYRLRPSVQSA